MIREPAVAGQFYPNDEKKLKKQIGEFLSKAKPFEKKPTAGIAPHAGYIYSGGTAAFTFKAIEKAKPRNIAIIGPNHTGIGEAVSIDSHSQWRTPLGTVSVNSELCEKIACGEFSIDPEAHEFEHSIEVQIPFIQTVFPNAEIVPICVGDQSEHIMRTLGEKLSKTLGKTDIVIASSDFSHYVPYKKAYENDLGAVKKIQSLETTGFYKHIKENSVSACGYGCIAAAIEFSIKRNSKKAELLKYTTSGDITGDMNSVVGYASLIFH